MPLRAFPTLLAASAASLALACADAPTASVAPPDRPSLITGNYTEDFEHPWVGLVAFYDANGEFLWRCSGSLLSPTVFLTAGHCIGDNEEQAVSARIWFAQDAGASSPYELSWTGVSRMTSPTSCVFGKPAG